MVRTLGQGRILAEINPMESRRKVFEKIYKDHSWGGQSRSGPGSDAAPNMPYLNCLVNLLEFNQDRISSVLDIGCGDWGLSKHVDWSGVSYHGVDIVPEIIESLQQEFSTDSIRFSCYDAIDDALPLADLVIVKDVLQHLSNASVMTMIHALQPFQYALITNDIQKTGVLSRIARFISPRRFDVNGEIDNGGARCLDLRDDPFNLNAVEVLRYEVAHRGVKFCKQSLVIQRPDAAPLDMSWLNSDTRQQ